jgi:hypothetical protein
MAFSKGNGTKKRPSSGPQRAKKQTKLVTRKKKKKLGSKEQAFTVHLPSQTTLQLAGSSGAPVNRLAWYHSHWSCIDALCGGCLEMPVEVTTASIRQMKDLSAEMKCRHCKETRKMNPLHQVQEALAAGMYSVC